MKISGIPIQVKMWNGPKMYKVFSLDVKLLDTITDVKAKIKDKKSIPLAYQKLLLDGKELDDDKTVFDSNMDEESTLNLFLRPIGKSCIHVSCSELQKPRFTPLYSC